jgi:hypothetical protein
MFRRVTDKLFEYLFVSVECPPAVQAAGVRIPAGDDLDHVSQ